MQDFWRDLSEGSQNAHLAERLREAQRTITDRPRISIRLRLVVSLALCFLLCVSFALSTLWLLGSVRQKLRILQAVESLDYKALRAQALSKDDILAGRDLGDALERVEAARTILASVSGDSGRAEDPVALAALDRHLERYRNLLIRFNNSSGQASVALDETGLREEEAEITALVKRLIAGERAAVDHTLWLSETVPFILITVLLVLFGVIAFFFTQALMDPIRRFQAYTRRIAEGDFTLIRPARSYRDEFSDLALAVNRMLAELRTNQDRCVRAGKLAAVGTITSGIAHELNNPLNNISITTEALMEDFKTLTDEEKWKLLQDIYFETERSSEIVKSLLDFTRNERPEMVPLDPLELVLSTHRLVQNEIALNNVNFTCDVKLGLPKVKGAPNQLRQVFLNLILNAVQAMPTGGNLWVTSEAEDPQRVCIEVRDDGPGIPPEVLPHIFDPFFTTKEPGLGTGLGLSVSYSIIKKHGGEIQVTSEPGKGTLFHVCLPRAEE
jgi:two-component system NtrC family sensor kinase